MREPKFRGYSKGTNSWHYGFGWIDIDYTDEFLEENGLEPQAMLYTEHSPVECELKSMGEYTGLKDKNGREIYEGDIAEDDLNSLGLVFYEDGSFKITSTCNGNSITNKNVYDLLDTSLIEDNNISVIGNIYEHPHLLGGDS